MTVQRVRVGDVLLLDRVPVEPRPEIEYTTVGIRSFGKGIFHYEPKPGNQLGSLRFFKLEPNRMVISNIKGWEGAIAVSGPAEQGALASNRFLTYLPIDGRVDVRWARWFFLSDAGLPLIQRASPGSADRNRTLAIERFENLEIPLPPLEEQRLVAARLDALRMSSTNLTDRATLAAEIDAAARDAMVAAVLRRGVESGWPVRSLSDVAQVNPRPSRVDADEPVTFVPMSAVDATRGSILAPDRRRAGDIGAGYKQFQHNDVIFARITPCMQNGKAAVFRDGNRFAYGSTEFHVVRPGPDVTPEWLHRIMRTRDFRGSAAERFTGTAGQQRVPADFLRTASLPVPSLDLQQEVVAVLDRILDASILLAEKRRHSKALLSAIGPAAMNQEFADLT